MLRKFLYNTLPLIALAAPSYAATVQVDFNSDQHGPISPTQSGWLGTDAVGNGTDGTFSVATTAIGSGAAIGDRDRLTANGGGAEQNMWQDFLFSNDASTGTTKGLQITISGLASNTEYPVTIWGFDIQSSASAPRVTDWSAAGGGSGTLSFDPANGLPTSLADYAITFNTTSNASGEIVITGLPSSSGSSSSHDVFINGLEIGDAVSEPSSLALFGLSGLIMTSRRARNAAINRG